jgi:phage-related protein
VTYYIAGGGRVPVRDFLDEIRDRKQLAALLADISLLSEEGPVLPFPLSSGIVSFTGLRELRTRHAGAQYRVVYTVRDGVVVLLHAFKKTASSQSRREYAVAASRARGIK